MTSAHFHSSPAEIRRSRRTPVAAGLLGLAWSGYGILQFLRTAGASAESLVVSGMTPEQAALYAGLPTWMTVVFAVGVFGGAAGSLLLVLGRPAAVGVLALSLAAYAALYVGDVALGVFDAFGAAHARSSRWFSPSRPASSPWRVALPASRHFADSCEPYLSPPVRSTILSVAGVV